MITNIIKTSFRNINLSKFISRKLISNRKLYLIQIKNLFHLDMMKNENEKISTTEATKKEQISGEPTFSFVKYESDSLKEKYGVLPFIQSQGDGEIRFKTNWNAIEELNGEFEGKEVKIPDGHQIIGFAVKKDAEGNIAWVDFKTWKPPR